MLDHRNQRNCPIYKVPNCLNILQAPQSSVFAKSGLGSSCLHSKFGVCLLLTVNSFDFCPFHLTEAPTLLVYIAGQLSSYRHGPDSFTCFLHFWDSILMACLNPLPTSHSMWYVFLLIVGLSCQCLLILCFSLSKWQWGNRTLGTPFKPWCSTLKIISPHRSFLVTVSLDLAMRLTLGPSKGERGRLLANFAFLWPGLDYI